MKTIKLLTGLAIASVVLFSACTKDGQGDPTPQNPMVVSTNPAGSATSTQNNVVMASFNQKMDPVTINLSTFVLNQGSTPVSGAVTYTDTTAIFTPTVNLSSSTVYTGTITTGAKNTAGLALASNYSFSFTTSNTPDLVLPVVNTTNPLNNATDVARNKTMEVTFSETMNFTTVNSSTFMLKQGTTVVSGTVAYAGTTATFNPSNTLAAGTIYTATITTGAKDLAGNALVTSTQWSFTTAGSISGLAAVNLGTAINYVILAKTAINNVPSSNITGDLGLSPAATSYITGLSYVNATGYATSAQVTGKIYAANMAVPTPINLTTAVNDMVTAYNDAAGRPFPDFFELGTGNIGGKTLSSGLYKWTNTVTVPSAVTISGGPNDIWIFQIAGNLSVSSAVNITLSGGAQAKNIFWQVAGTVTIGTTANFKGVIMSKTGITLGTGATLDGRALAQTAVILDKNTVTKPQ